MDLVEEFAACPPSGSTAESWKALQNQFESMAAEDVAAQFLPTLKMTKAFSLKGERQLTIIFKANGDAFERTLKQVLLSFEGACLKQGTPPRGALERGLQGYLDGTVKGKGRGTKRRGGDSREDVCAR